MSPSGSTQRRLEHFQALARELDICLVFGFAEKTGGDVYNCAVFIDHQGRICGKHHKMQLAEGYHEGWWFNRLGKQIRAFDTPFGRCGIMICNDRWNPQLARILALDGAQFLAIPSFGSTSKAQDKAVLARGVENGLPVIEANVGVSLIVSNDQIVAVDRQRDGITFAEISIPQERAIDQAARDREEAEFCKWRDNEMPIRLAQRMTRLGKVLPATQATEESAADWYDAKDIGLEGKAWEDTEAFFDRLPARAKERVRPPVWALSRNSAGLCVHFLTNAETIHARWKLRSDELAMPHMAATGVSGVDLYVRHAGSWRWLATGQPRAQVNTARLADRLPRKKREYLLYLPLYNGVTSVEIGASEQRIAVAKAAEARSPTGRILGNVDHSGCVCVTPGMCHTAILGRRLNRPIVNLGFSGNGKMEPEVAELMAEIDAAVYVVDCLPNLTADLVTQRVRRLVEIVRSQRKETPILLVEDRTYSDAFLVDANKRRNDANRAALFAAYEQMRQDGIAQLHYLEGNQLLGSDGEDTVDGSHPTDLGFFRQAKAFEAALRSILGDD